jgi:hypothetical protein
MAGLDRLSSSAVPPGQSPARGEHRPGKVAQVLDKVAALGKGALVDGPRHTFESIRENPLQFGAMLAGIGVVGAAARVFRKSAELPMIGLSGAALAYQLKQNAPDVFEHEGRERWERFGADILWPTALVAATVAGGHAVGPTKASLATKAAPPELGRVGAQSMLLGGDAPMVFMTARGSREHG